MSFPTGSRVVLLKPYLGIPSFNFGTVAGGGPVTANVDFDGHPDTVLVPNMLLRLAGERLAQARHKSTEAKHAATWYPPRSLTSGCWISVLEFPVTGSPANLNVDMRDIVDQPDGARSSMTIVIDDLPNTIRFQGEQVANGTQTFNAAISGAPSQTVTIIILYERPPGADDLLLALDNLDIRIV